MRSTHHVQKARTLILYSIGVLLFLLCVLSILLYPIQSIPESIHKLFVLSYIPGEDILLEKAAVLNNKEQQEVSECLNGFYMRTFPSTDTGYRQSITINCQTGDNEIEYVIYSSGYVRINGDYYLPISKSVDTIYTCISMVYEKSISSI